MVKDHSDSERGNLFLIDSIAHTMFFVTPDTEYWLE